MYAVLGNTYAAAGAVDRARTILEELRQRLNQRRAAVIDLAYVHAGLGELDAAVDCLERAVDERLGLVVYLKVEPMADPLRDHPRFRALLDRLRL